MENKKRSLSLLLTLLLAGSNLAALNVLLSGMSTARLDLTSEGLYSISPVTERMLASLDEDLTIYGYFSNRTHPKLAPLVPEITDLLEEYRAVSNGRVNVEVLDPGGDEATEQEAADRFGVNSTPFRLATKYESAIVNAYFAVVIRYGDQYVRYGFEDLIIVDPSPDGDINVRLRNLEYDLTRAIKKVVYGFRSTNELFERVEGPISLTAIWTPDALPEVLSEVPAAVLQAVSELKEAAGEKMTFDELDPSADEALAQQVFQTYGARPMSLGLFSEQEFYLYGFLNVGGSTEQLALTGEVTAASVRESIENALRRHTPGFLKTIGVFTSEAPQIPPEMRMQMQMPPQPPPEFQEVKRQLSQDYQVKDVQLGGEQGVPSDVDVLLVLKPANLDERTIYNLDQYLMRGGRVVICAGNYSADFGMQGLSVAPVTTGLSDWLAHHGVTIENAMVLDDRNQRLPIPEVRQTPFGQMRTWSLVPYPYLVQVREDGFLNPEITATLDSVGIYWGSPIAIDETTTGEALEVLPILRSSEMSWTDDNIQGVNSVEYSVPAGTESRMLAAALSGTFTSYFAESGPPAPTPDPAAQGAEPVAAQPTEVALKQSPETRLVVVGNSQFVSDFVARALAQVDGGFFVENLRFVQNLIDWTSLDNDMLQIRARGMATRRLDRVEESTQVFVELFNYAAPAVILLILGVWLRWRRRQTLPLNQPTRPDLTTTPQPQGGVGQ